MRLIPRTSNKEKMNKVERTNQGRGLALTMGLANMHVDLEIVNEY
jgi:hypothetical protein